MISQVLVPISVSLWKIQKKLKVIKGACLPGYPDMHTADFNVLKG